LPTEAEWEYACRAGTTTQFYYGDDPAYLALTNYAWYRDNSNGETHPVAQMPSNPWGLYDMSGNVSEWCQDWYGPYPGGTVTNFQGAATGTYRVLRGGSFLDYPRDCRSAVRTSDDPTTGNFNNYGFRVVLTPSQ
jgi:formylglycine-generating enzyme required for sulfatase activity